MVFRRTSYNYTDGTPGLMKDINLFNQLDQEQFSLHGLSLFYYKFSDFQKNYDEIYRDFVSSPEFDQPIELRGFLNVDPNTTHGMTDTGADQTAERSGTVSFNISLIESLLGRQPVLGDVVFSVQLKQKFQVYEIAKDTYRMAKPLRYLCKIRLYQDSK